MRFVNRERILLTLCLLYAAAMFMTGITWGLPSRAADPYLFGTRTPWTGEEILSLGGGWSADPTKGADVDLNPLADRSKPLILNETDAQRAEIVRRYRLFTYQPDEWITMRSLAGMKPGLLQLDPKVYQYGGLWIYPVGAMLKAASMVGFIDLRGGPEALAYYIDHPEAFGRFYVVTRLYSVAWGIIATWAAYALSRRLTGSMAGAVGGALCFASMPVVVSMAHEAKPHLAGLALMLLATLAACRFVESGATRWWMAAGALCGAAFGMVISSLVIFVLIPVMTCLRSMTWRQRAAITFKAGVVGLVVYAMTNPFVWINAIRNPAVLRSNIGTSTAMYNADAGGGAVVNSVRLIMEGTSVPVAATAFVTLLSSAIFAVRSRQRTVGPAVVLILAPALLVGVQFVALSRGKPGEYARFGLLPDTALALSAVAGVSWLFARRPKVLAGAMGVLIVGTAFFGITYVQKFVADTRPITSRLLEAERLKELNADGLRRIRVIAEPAPYCLPPVDLFTTSIELAPRGPVSQGGGDMVVRAVDARGDEFSMPGFLRLGPAEDVPRGRFSAPITWADKPFEVFIRTGQ